MKLSDILRVLSRNRGPRRDTAAEVDKKVERAITRNNRAVDQLIEEVLDQIEGRDLRNGKDT